MNPFAGGRVHRGGDAVQHRDWEDRRWESGFKLDIPEFHGGVKGEKLLDWLVAVDEILEFKEVPEDKKLL